MKYTFVTLQAVLLRAGQPLYGPKHRRCKPDEQLLNSVVNVGMKGIIYDLRSSNLISQQQNKGKHFQYKQINCEEGSMFVTYILRLGGC